MIDFACKRFDLDEIVKCGFGLTKGEFFIFKNFFGRDNFCTTEEISKRTKFNLTTVQKAVKKMYEEGILVRRQKNLSKGGYIFEYKIKNKREIRDLVKKLINKWTKTVEERIDRW